MSFDGVDYYRYIMVDRYERCLRKGLTDGQQRAAMSAWNRRGWNSRQAAEQSTLFLPETPSPSSFLHKHTLFNDTHISARPARECVLALTFVAVT